MPVSYFDHLFQRDHSFLYTVMGFAVEQRDRLFIDRFLDLFRLYQIGAADFHRNGSAQSHDRGDRSSVFDRVSLLQDDFVLKSC